MPKITNLNELVALSNLLYTAKNSKKVKIIISTKATCCYLKGSQEVQEEFEKEIKKYKLEHHADILTTGCLGFCAVEPIVIVKPSGVFYPSVDKRVVPNILKASLEGQILDELLYNDSVTSKKYTYTEDIPFYKKQKQLVFKNCINIDPEKIEDYIAYGGYKALCRALTQMTPTNIVEEVKLSGLRGRGGAGFPTGRKWEILSKEKCEIKYIICNADEGDPGAYMDRGILESNPHSVIEGMIIGAYAMNASSGWIYIRDEYPLAVEHIKNAIVQARNYGFLGNNILNTGFNFDIKIAKGAGAFVCGEETALIQSIEGKRGMPKQRPPYPVQSGLFGKPTCINNVETWANIPLIIIEGANWFKAFGTANSKGTKIFSLVGKVKNVGLVEVPMGIKLDEIIFDIGGGAPDNKKVKAVQIGGPSGGCIPAELFHLPIDYESLVSAGAIMGSGGMIVMDEETCMVDIAKYFTNFLQDESCGKCSTCREGTQRIYEILCRITDGKGSEEHLELLENLSNVIKNASLCGLGQTAPNSVLTTLKYFKDEYINHIKNKYCSAGVCKALIRYYIDPAKCTGCLVCKRNCPQKAIKGEKGKPHLIIDKKCIKCGICYEVCKFYSISKHPVNNNKL